MAKYTDSQLADRVSAVLYSNSAGEIDAVDLRDLLLDFVDSKLTADASIGIPAHGSIDADDLVDNEIIVTHNLNTTFPVVFIKSSAAEGDVFSAIHFSYGPSGANDVWVHFEEDLDPGTSVEYIVVKFV
jgi:hypothetical protein